METLDWIEKGLTVELFSNQPESLAEVPVDVIYCYLRTR